MNPRRHRRTIAAACILVLLAVPVTWFGRQYRQMTLNHALIAAIKESNAGKVDYLLTAGADPNTRDTPVAHESLLQELKHILHPPPDLHPTALLIALNQRLPNIDYPPDYSKIVKALLEKGASVHVADYHDLTPVTALFCHCSDDGNSFDYTMTETTEAFATLKLLLAAGADANKAGPSGQTPLMLACSCGGTETARILLDHGANPNPKSLLPGNITPLMLAKQDGDTEMVRLLKAHGAKK